MIIQMRTAKQAAAVTSLTVGTHLSSEGGGDVFAIPRTTGDNPVLCQLVGKGTLSPAGTWQPTRCCSCDLPPVGPAAGLSHKALSVAAERPGQACGPLSAWQKFRLA